MYEEFPACNVYSLKQYYCLYLRKNIYVAMHKNAQKEVSLQTEFHFT